MAGGVRVQGQVSELERGNNMADGLSGTDGAGCVDEHSRVRPDGIDHTSTEWELVPSSAREADYASIVELCETNQQYIVGTAPGTDEILYMNYFALTSENSSGNDRSEQRSSPVEVVHDLHGDESPPSIAPELDWIEPSSPVRSCALVVTDEEDDSPSRSCSDESREGAERQSPDTSAIAETDVAASGPSSSEKQGSNLLADLERECLGKDDSAAAFLKSPMEGTEASKTEAIEVAGDYTSTSNEPDDNGYSIRWMARFGAWISEAGRTNTLWSLGLAAAVIGLIALGNGWQRFRLQCERLRVRVLSKGKVMDAVFFSSKPPATLISWSRGLESFPFSNFLL